MELKKSLSIWLENLTLEPVRDGTGVRIKWRIADGENPFEKKIDHALAAVSKAEKVKLFTDLFVLWYQVVIQSHSRRQDEARKIFGPQLTRCLCGRRHHQLLITISADNRELKIWSNLPDHIGPTTVKDSQEKPIFSLKVVPTIPFVSNRYLLPYIGIVIGTITSHLSQSLELEKIRLNNGTTLFMVTSEK